MKYQRFVTALVVGAMGAGSLTAASAAPAAEPKHASGISLVGPGPYQARPRNKAEAIAHDTALREAEASPADLGYPWLSNGTLVQRHLTPKGRSLAAKIRAPIPRQDDAARRSFRDLERIKDDIMLLQKAGVPDADALISSEPDDRHNRIIVTVQRLSDGLMTTLASLYGTEAVAVRVDPSAQRPHLDVGRENDIAPYSGGARYITPEGGSCTLGFPWTTGFITAGHCVHSGGTSKSVVLDHIGITQPTTDENWENGVGTTSFPGDPADISRGDLGIIRTPSPTPYFVSHEIYVGLPGSSSKRTISGMWNAAPKIDDLYCTGGYVTGELCGWKVTGTRMNVYYPATGTVWEVTRGRRQGSGTIKGDSGGPVYTVRADGTVVAKGIHSGAGQGSGYFYEYFTDIRLAAQPLGGTLNTNGTSQPFLIYNANSSKCLDVEGGSKLDSAKVVQWTCHGASNQQWYRQQHPTVPGAIRIINAGSGKCLAIGSSSTQDGAKAIQYSCIDTSAGQTWYDGGNDTIVNQSGKCLAIGSGSQVNGANAIQWACIGSNSQKWYWGYLE